MRVFSGHFFSPAWRNLSAPCRVSLMRFPTFAIDWMRLTISGALYSASIFHGPVWSRPPMIPPLRMPAVRPVQEEHREPDRGIVVVFGLLHNQTLSVPRRNCQARVFHESAEFLGPLEGAPPEA